MGAGGEDHPILLPPIVDKMHSCRKNTNQCVARCYLESCSKDRLWKSWKKKLQAILHPSLEFGGHFYSTILFS